MINVIYLFFYHNYQIVIILANFIKHFLLPLGKQLINDHPFLLSILQIMGCF